MTLNQVEYLSLCTSLFGFSIYFTMMFLDSCIRKKAPSQFQIVTVPLCWTAFWLCVQFL